MLITCQHLQPLEGALRAAACLVEYEGRSWWDTPSRGMWVYFRCVLDEAALRQRFHLPEWVGYSEYDGHAAGHEAGFVCRECGSAVMGVHPSYADGTTVFR